MTMRRALPLLLCGCLCLAAPAHAAATSRPRPATAAPAKRATAPRRPAVVKAARDSARTLDPIHIEGELDVPEVLFITARDQRRIVEFQHRRYLKTSTELLHDAPPTRLVVARGTTPATAPAAAPAPTAPSASGDPR